MIRELWYVVESNRDNNWQEHSKRIKKEEKKQQNEKKIKNWTKL